MATQWVDFKAVKSAVTMRMVLDHYQVKGLKRTRDELRGRCPIHRGDGEDAFHVSTSKNCFQCFSCKARGNVMDFVAAMEKCGVRDAAVKLAGWFGVGKGLPLTTPEQRVGTFAGKNGGKSSPAESGGVAAMENKALTFQLKDVDTSHAYLVERGIERETAELFGVGYFAGKGSMSGRVVIPIHNERGELVAYAGRTLIMPPYAGSHPKYQFPAGFHKALELFNVHRAVQDNKRQGVVIVEGFFDCMKVYQAGYPCVALMGCSMSQWQEELLAKTFRLAFLLLDGDEVGRAGAAECAARLVRRMFVKVVSLDDGKQPDMLSADELQALLG